MPVLTGMAFLLMRPVQYYFTFLLIFASTTSSFSQHYDNTWMFGYFGGATSPNNDTFGITVFDFSGGSLNISDNQEIILNFDATNVEMSDSLGNLMFYTNGIDIGDISWNTILNGANIHPALSFGLPVSQGALVLPIPEQLHKFSLLHVLRGYIGAPVWTVGVLALNYSIVDMTQNNGLGAVTEKSIPLLVDTLQFGKLQAVKHANGRDWWILVPEAYTNNIYRILLNPEGFHVLGKQTIGKKLYPGLGQAVFSPDGSRYAIYDAYSFNMPEVLDVYDFDRCSGFLSNSQHLVVGPASYSGGVTFSPNSRYLYLHTTLVVAQYDLQASDLAASRVELAWHDGYESPFPTHFFAGQIAPDGKIYICTSNGTDVLHVIHRPDEAGAACMIEQHGIRLPTYNSGSMPNFPNYRLGPLDGWPCDSLGLDNHPVAWWRYEQDTLDPLWVEFRDLSYYEPTYWHWNFGDGNTSLERHPVHEYSKAGPYQVCLIVGNGNSADTLCRTLYLGVSGQENPVLQSQIQVTPNPFRGRLCVALTAKLRSPEFILYDQTGRLVLTEQLTYGVTLLDTWSLLGGIYYWAVRSEGRTVKIGKLVKVPE